MSTSTTTNIALVKDGSDEPVKNHREHFNGNMDAIDTAIKAVQDASTSLDDARQNLVALLGNLGLDGSGNPLVSKASARATLDAAQSESASGSLYDAEQAISDIVADIGTVPSGKTLQGQIQTLQDSVGKVTFQTARQIGGIWANSNNNTFFDLQQEDGTWIRINFSVGAKAIVCFTADTYSELLANTGTSKVIWTIPMTMNA